MTKQFHLSIGVRSLKDTADFYRDVLGAEITHEGEYTNLDLYGTQITLKDNPSITVDLPDLHFGVNLPLAEFSALGSKHSY